jgi:hypothetical protein
MIGLNANVISRLIGAEPPETVLAVFGQPDV